MRDVKSEYQQLCEKMKLSTETYHGPLLHVYHDRVILPNGHEAGRDYIKHLGAVCMIPVLDKGQVILEVKFDDFLPGYLADALADIPKTPMAISKFALCMNLI